MGVKNYIDQKGNLYFYLMPPIKYSPSHPSGPVNCQLLIVLTPESGDQAES